MQAKRTSPAIEQDQSEGAFCSAGTGMAGLSGLRSARNIQARRGVGRGYRQAGADRPLGSAFLQQPAPIFEQNRARFAGLGLRNQSLPVGATRCLN